MGETCQERRAFPEFETNFSSSFSGLLGTGMTVSTCFGSACFAAVLPFGAFLRGAGADDGLCSLLTLLLPDLADFELRAAGFIGGQ